MGRFIIVAAIAALATSSAWAQATEARDRPTETTSHDKLSQADQSFLSYAAEDNQAEIQLCILAEKNARAPAVKAFARLMVNDHAAIESRLAALINAEQVQVPTGVGKEGQDTFAKLSKLSGAEFDREFIDAQIEDHGHDLDKFGKEQASSGNEGAKRFASETVPILEQHLKLAKAVKAAITQGETK